MGTLPPIPHRRWGIKPPIVQRFGEFHARIQTPAPCHPHTHPPYREAVYLAGRGVVAEVRMSFPKSPEAGRGFNAPPDGGGWGASTSRGGPKKRLRTEGANPLPASGGPKGFAASLFG